MFPSIPNEHIFTQNSCFLNGTTSRQALSHGQLVCIFRSMRYRRRACEKRSVYHRNWLRHAPSCIVVQQRVGGSSIACHRACLPLAALCAWFFLFLRSLLWWKSPLRQPKPCHRSGGRHFSNPSSERTTPPSKRNASIYPSLWTEFKKLNYWNSFEISDVVPRERCVFLLLWLLRSIF